MEGKGSLIRLDKRTTIVCVPHSAIEGFPQKGVYLIRGASHVVFIPFPVVNSYVFTLMGQLGLDRKQSLQLEGIVCSMDSEVTASSETLARVSITKAK